MSNRLFGRAAACALATVCLGAGAARADVTIERSMSVEGAGAMSVANMSGTTKTLIAGQKSRTDTQIEVKSRLVKMLAHGAFSPTAEIVRLDEDKVYQLNIDKKRYTETSFEQLRQRLEKMRDRSGETDDRQQPSAIDESKCDWLPPRVDVKKTGQKAQIAGFDSDEVTITAAQPCKDKTSGSICEVALGLDEWVAPGFTENAEVQRYYKAYAAKVGIDVTATSQDASERARALLSRYKGVWDEIARKMQGVKGYPVKSSFTLAVGGPQCQKSDAKDSASHDDTSAGPGGLPGQVASKLGSLFHKKSDSDGAASQAPPATPTNPPPPVPDGDVPVLTVNSQLVAVSAATASPDAFDIPAGFTKEAAAQ